ncbi:protein-disulfide reductase DsbD domain-containing protein [Frigidibacter sp. ROC022]|uniref:protein-disulfide reductase DsbD domain-containing protein n=1 Tax=Frigidibacter sp. ROC022 TaxID=2971796 RepID=UPI00215A6124|nr:protein-disulfide reductase DsbD domain-containing protein [Frigidibacter sp. ROC022]MCR8724930.1 protein-disulfide reductase DsbD family protein [Frigidibacter sp. ROC022]
MMLSRLSAAVTLLALLFPVAARAGTYGTTPTEQVAQVEVLPGWREGAVHIAALRIRLAPGWKTYWRAPGDAGIPPSFSWKGSRNLAGLRFHWPVPHVFSVNGMRSIGYKGEVILPIYLDAARPDQPIALRGELDMGVCLDICVPVQVRISADIPAQGTHDPRIAAALADRAQTAAEAGLKGASCAVEPISDGLRLTARITLPKQGGSEVVVVETPTPGVWVSDAASLRKGGVLQAVADLVPPEAQPFALDRSSLRFTVIGAGRAVDIQGCTGD